MVTSRIWFTAAQKAELWERWKNGQSAAAISRALERKNKTGVERIVVLHGGIVPARRCCSSAGVRPYRRAGQNRKSLARTIDHAPNVNRPCDSRTKRRLGPCLYNTSNTWRVRSLAASEPVAIEQMRFNQLYFSELVSKYGVVRK